MRFVQYITYDDYKWYIQALEKLWMVDVLSDSQHDRALAKLERMFAGQKEKRAYKNESI